MNIKHRALILLLLFSSASAFAELHGALEIGKVLEDTSGYAKVDLLYTHTLGRLELDAFGGWLTWFDATDSLFAYSPFQDIYSVGARVMIKPFYLQIKHFCNHPVVDGYLRRGEIREVLTAVSVGVRW